VEAFKEEIEDDEADNNRRRSAEDIFSS